jgi:hypothetical protein
MKLCQVQPNRFTLSAIYALHLTAPGKSANQSSSHVGVTQSSSSTSEAVNNAEASDAAVAASLEVITPERLSDIFEIDLKTNSITDSPKEKFITINFTGKLNSKVNEGAWFHDKHEIKSQFNGPYNSKFTIGNDPYLEKVNINFQDQYVRKIN